MTTLRLLALAALPVIAAGCSCNETSFSGFPALDVDTYEPPTSIGSWLSMDVSPDGGRLTMGYYDRVRTAAVYAVGTVQPDGTVAWAHEPVDGNPASNGLDPGDMGKYGSQKTAPDGTVWFSYLNATPKKLRVAHRVGPNGWGEPADVDDGGLWTSLAIGADGNPVVAHCTDDGTVKVSRFDGSTWSSQELYTSQPVDTVPAGVAYTAVAIAGGREIVAFQDTATGDLHVVTDGQDEIVDQRGNVGAWPAIWTDGTKVRVAYHDVDNQDLLLATQQDPGADWTIDLIDDGDMRGADAAIWQLEGEPQIAYFDGMDNDLWVARRSDTSWDTERVGEDGAAIGFHNEVVVVGGQVWLGSYDYTNDGLFLRAL